MGKNDNETTNENEINPNANNPLDGDNSGGNNDTGNTSANEVKDDARFSLRDEAPLADQPERVTLSKAPDLKGDAPGVKTDEEKKDEPKKDETQPTEKRIAGGMQTVTDRQALLAREMSKKIGKYDIDGALEMYSQARDALTDANKNLNDTPETIAKRDEAVANLLAVHQSMVNSKDKKIKEFAESCVEVNRWSFGITKEDTAKFSQDMADPNTDWKPVEDKIDKENQPKRLAAYAKAELEGLKGKDPNELIDYFNKARHDTKSASAENGKNNTKESQEAYERSLGKMLAGEYLLRGSSSLQAKSALSAANNIYANTFHLPKADRDALMKDIENAPVPEPKAEEVKKEETPVNTPTVEGVAQPVNEKNEYPEEPKQNAEPVKTGEKLSPEQLKDKMEHAGGILEATVGKKTVKDDLAKFEKTMAGLQNLSPELRGPMFAQMFREHAKNEMQSSVSATLNGRKNGKMGATFPEASAATQKYLQAQFEYFTSQNPDLKDMKYPPLGGLQPSEIREMQNKALLSLPLTSQQPGEKKAIGEEYAANKDSQKNAVSADFRAHVAELNKEQGVQFSAAGIEKYLASRWKEGAEKDLDTQRDNFQKEYREFKEKAYEKMLSKIDGKTDLKKQLASFDKFCTQLDTLCKSKGWVDKDTPYAFAGDLSADSVKNMQTKAVDGLPKNTAEKAVDTLAEISGDKERRLQAENAKRQKEEIDKIKGTSKKDKAKRKNLQDKAALDAKNSKKKLEQKEKNFKGEIQKCLDAVPANPQSFDNPAVRNALGMVRALENKLGEHGRAWRAFHPFQTRNLNNAINGIMEGLDKKGYKKEAIDHLLHNPQKPEDDPVSQDVNKQKNDIKEMQGDREKIETQQREFEKNKEKPDLGERITVPEADNVKDIVNPKERSQFIVPQRTNELTVGGPTQNNPQQQPKGPTSGK